MLGTPFAQTATVEWDVTIPRDSRRCFVIDDQVLLDDVCQHCEKQGTTDCNIYREEERCST